MRSKIIDLSQYFNRTFFEENDAFAQYGQGF
jgi:hypothetical protein